MSELKLPSLNKVFLTGVLVKNPEFKRIDDDVPQSTMLLAVGRKYRDYLGKWHEETNYIRVVTWQKLAELCHKYLIKGSPILVEGELQSRVQEIEEGESILEIEVDASRIQFLGKIKKDVEESTKKEIKEKFAEFERFDY